MIRSMLTVPTRRNGHAAPPTARGVSGHRLGLALATLMGGWHLLWSALVLFDWAQPALDFVFWLHFIAPPYQVGAFVFGRATGLIALTASLGYVFGQAIAAIWNVLHPEGT